VLISADKSLGKLKQAPRRRNKELPRPEDWRAQNKPGPKRKARNMWAFLWLRVCVGLRYGWSNSKRKATAVAVAIITTVGTQKTSTQIHTGRFKRKCYLMTFNVIIFYHKEENLFWG